MVDSRSSGEKCSPHCHHPRRPRNRPCHPQGRLCCHRHRHLHRHCPCLHWARCLYSSALAGSHGLGPLPLSRLNKSSVFVFGPVPPLDPLPPSGLSPAGPPLNLPRSASSRDALFAGCLLSASSASSSRSPSLTSTPASTRPPTSAPATNPIGAAGPASTAPATPPPTTLAVPPVSTIARSFDPSGAIFSMLASPRCLMHAGGREQGASSVCSDCTRCRCRALPLLRRGDGRNVDVILSRQVCMQEVRC